MWSIREKNRRYEKLFAFKICRVLYICYLCIVIFHSIRFKVNKDWSKALLLFLCPYFYEVLWLFIIFVMDNKENRI